MYVRTVGPPAAKIFLVGEAPGEEEDKYGKPFIGEAGRKLDSLLSEAGISRNECLIGNVARKRPPGNKIDFFYQDNNKNIPKPDMLIWIEELKNEILQFKPNIVVAMGDTAMKTLCDLRGIGEYRGYITESTLVKGQKVLPTYHPQKTNYEWKLGFTFVMDIRKAIANSLTPDLPVDRRKLYAQVSYNAFIDYVDSLADNPNNPIALDIETTDVGCHTDIIGIADSPYHAMSFQLIEGGHAVLNPAKEAQLWRAVGNLLSKVPCIMHNGVFDMAVLWHHNHVFTKHLIYDTLIAGHVCWPECPRSLAYLSSICCNVPAWKHTASVVPALYNCADAANTYGVWEYLKKEMDRREYWNIFNFEMKQVYPATMMQLQGLFVDPVYRDELKKKVTTRIAELDAELEQDLGKKVNLNSPKQMQSLLYIDMRLPVQYKRRKSATEERKITTDSSALMNLSRKSKNPLLDKIMEYKKLDKLVSSFLDITTSPSSRVHTSYNITGATMLRKRKALIVDDEDSYKSFSRWSSSASIILPYGSGNLQNIPKAARTIYRAQPGSIFVEADYIQAEAEVVAFNIGDEPMKLLFKHSFGMTKKDRTKNNYDIHKLTAAMMNGKDVSEVTPEERRIGKTLRHAINYSAGPAVVSNNVGCSLAEAKLLLSKFHSVCPQLRLWHAKIQNDLRKSRVLVNAFGRKHMFLERWGDQLFRSAYSYIPQSTVGDLLNLALVRLYEKHGEEMNIIIQLHDAIYVEVKESEVQSTIDKMRECMLIPIQSPYGEEYMIDVDFSIGYSWGEMEDYS